MAVVRVLHLIRHGQYDVDQGDAGELTELGRRQAALLGARLSSMKRPPTPTLTSSSMLRARQTADVLAEALPFARTGDDPDLAEGFPVAPPSGEPGLTAADLEAEAERFERCWAACSGPDAPEWRVVVSHGNWIRGLVARALDTDLATLYRFGLFHASLTTLLFTPDGPHVARVNDTGHLPPELSTMR